jgi:multisubunit Na+/H+ antiporter MnhB subunit
MTLFAFAGGLLAALLFLLANALFRRRWNEKTGRIVVGIIAAGLLLFATGAGTAWYGSWQEQVKAYDSLQVSTVNLPAEFAGVKKLVVTAHSVGSPFNGPTNELAVEYAVDTRNAPRYELTALPGMEPHIVVDGDEARIAFKSNAAHNQFQGWIQPRLVIRGPALEELRVNQGIASYSTAYPDGQQQLKIWTGGTTRASISGQYQAVYVEGDGDTDVSSSSVTDLVIAMTGGSVTAGVVKTLAVTQPDACSAWGSYDSRMRVQVRAVSSGSLTYNGKNTPAHSPISNGCGLVVVEDNAETLTD